MPPSTSVSEAQGYSSIEQAGIEAGRFMDESGYSQDATTAKRRRSAESPTQRYCQSLLSAMLQLLIYTEVVVL